MKKELEWTWSWGSWGGSMVRTCRVEHLAAGCSSSEQFPFIHFINTSSSVTSSWLENTHTHTHTHARTHTRTHMQSPLPLCLHHKDTHAHFLSPAALLRFCESRRASLRLIATLQPLPSSLSPITRPREKKKKKWRKGPSRLVPMATALLFSCSAQSIRQRLSRCPALAWLKRRGAGAKYHFHRFWCSGYFWVIFTHSVLLHLFLCFYFRVPLSLL